MPKIQPQTKVLIIKSLKTKSPAEVADIFNVSKRQVERIRKRFEETGEVHDRPSRRKYCRRPIGTRMDPRFTQKTVKFRGGKIMVWGYIQYGGMREICRVDGNINSLRKAKSNQATKILMNMFVSLCLLNAAFLSNESVANTQDNTACVFIALVLHYSMLASFTWFFIQALHMYLWLIRQNVTITNYMRKITVLGWVCPAPIVTVIASVRGYKAVTLNTMCWIINPYIHYTVNIGYYALVFIFTTGIFIIIVTKVVQARIIRATDGKRKTFRKQLMMVLSLFLLFGLTWAVMFFSYGAMIIPSYYIFTVLNSFQGFFLFLYYYHIHNDIEGHFSDDPETNNSNTTISQSSINAVCENIHN
ncbi:adhesion G- coupled receptor G2-like protein [Labeo rohita]|uniref:Adhesion G-coupled receptor G2-like protein n=1 Tax=Labeo rohita TaxID=84645 RepID=A0A498P0F3_LABRO|nr:adhesion G- coupled receptor G2-like protein [Labeo rohita]